MSVIEKKHVRTFLSDLTLDLTSTLKTPLRLICYLIKYIFVN